MRWIKIDRDKDGFATDSAMNIMFAHLPFIIATEFNQHGIEVFYNVVTYNNFEVYMGDIRAEARITHYLRIPKIK